MDDREDAGDDSDSSGTSPMEIEFDESDDDSASQEQQSNGAAQQQSGVEQQSEADQQSGVEQQSGDLEWSSTHTRVCGKTDPC